uniref:Uncharacterized protein n=1 Tax=Meloidogyne enterolobii TaxID=390850 RepID=A0A6V7UX02_MELEN|nr:unnamed protein product [Meloidogyne enterolobii]
MFLMKEIPCKGKEIAHFPHVPLTKNPILFSSSLDIEYCCVNLYRKKNKMIQTKQNSILMVM